MSLFDRWGKPVGPIVPSVDTTRILEAVAECQKRARTEPGGVPKRPTSGDWMFIAMRLGSRLVRVANGMHTVVRPDFTPVELEAIGNAWTAERKRYGRGGAARAEEPTDLWSRFDARVQRLLR